MKSYNFARHLGAVSALALTAAAAIASVQPASAETILGGGASLVSLVIRDLGDCYNGFQPNGAPSARAACTAPGYANANSILYASVGSGAGRRAYSSNDSRQLLAGPLPTSELPSILPTYLGYGVTKYPYERSGALSIDFASSEAALDAPIAPAVGPAVRPWVGFTPATGWETLAPPPAVAITGLANGAASTYNAAKLGNVVQVPFAEVGVAIGVNAPTPANVAPWRIAYRGTAAAPVVISLTQAQICAIFSGAVKDWNDSTTDIAFRDATNVLGTYKFAAPNGGLSYTTSSVPIKVAYRSDGSGTTFILLNFLNAVCPFFDDGGTNKYSQIFGAPTTNFSDLITRINTAFPGAGRTANWVGDQGNVGVAALVSNFAADSSKAGTVGYLSADFVKPYSTVATAPTPAALQDEAHRLRGWEVPAAVRKFAELTPANLGKAWIGFPAPSATLGDYTTFNPYLVTQLVHGGLTKSRLATPLTLGAYPINGTGFLFFYSCYKDPTGDRVNAITDFMSWLYAGQVNSVTYPVGTPSTSTRNAPKFDANVKTILNAAGFNPLPVLYARRVIDRYVRTASRQSIASLTAPAVRGCVGVAGGAD